MSKAIFVSDSHGCKKYLRYAISLAKERGADNIFHCGDIGHNILKWFAEETDDLGVYLVRGNHDRMKKLRRISNKYDHVNLLRNTTIEFDETYIVSKGLPYSMHMGKRYKRTLDQLLGEVSAKPRVLLFTHYNDLKGLKTKGILNIHGHKHINKWWMYVIKGKYCRLDKLMNYYHKDTTYSHNVALRVLMVDFEDLSTEWLL